MYVIREFEDAIQDCQAGCIDCNDDPVHAWDEGVAFYTGSLEGTDGSGSGKLIHALADKRCKDFGTCNGGSAVNVALSHLFRLGQGFLVQGRCSKVPPIKRRVVELMSIPLVQGALRYAYKVDKEQGGSKEKAEGAAFSAAILPRIHACDASAAQTIGDNMHLDSSSHMAGGFAKVKQAFESTYACLGITCADVGGIIISGTQYHESAEPCTASGIASPVGTTFEMKAFAPQVSDSGNAVLYVVLACAIAIVVLLGSIVVFLMRKHKLKDMEVSGVSLAADSQRSSDHLTVVVGQPIHQALQEDNASEPRKEAP
jgi:hypothetical protein